MANFLSSLLGTGADAVAKQQALINAKKGKNNEQKDVIDFLQQIMPRKDAVA